MERDVPSYVAEYACKNNYSNTPLVYSFFPLVPVFTKNILVNSENKKCESLNNSDGSMSSIESIVVSNQDNKLKEFLELQVYKKSFLNYETENLHVCDGSAFYQLDNSCNAVDINISRKESENADTELSFDGKIMSNEEKRLHNESFEMLSKEDSSKMLFLNEKSPDLFEKKVYINISDNNTSEKTEKQSLKLLRMSDNKADVCEISILNKLNSAMSGIRPPPSITHFQMSLHDMLLSFKKKSCSFFKPTNTMKEVLKMEWPDIIRTKFHDIAYQINSF